MAWLKDLTIAIIIVVIFMALMFIGMETETYTEETTKA